MADPVTLAALMGSLSAAASTAASTAAAVGTAAAANAGTIATVSTIAGAGLTAAGTMAQARAQEAAANSSMGLANAQAEEGLAVSSRDAARKDKETRMLLSRAQAVSAASGGSATDDTVLQMMGNIGAQGNVDMREIKRQGQESANMTRYQGKLGLATAKANTNLSYYQAGGQLLTGVSDAYTKYNAVPPKPKSTAIPEAGSSPWWLGAAGR